MAISKITSDAIDATGFNLDSNTFTIDSTNNRVGIGTATPNSYYSKELVVAHGTEGGITLVGAAGTATGYLMFADGTTGNEAYRGYVGYSHSTPDVMVFGTSGAERMRILSGGGLTFNGDTATANALDDYEEGSWTPTIGNGTVNANSPRYVKIGQQVTVWGYLTTFSDRSTASSVNIGGLPFQSASDNFSSGVTIHRYINAGGDSVTAYIPQSTSTMTFYASNQNSAYTNVLHSQLSSTSTTIFFTATYRA